MIADVFLYHLHNRYKSLSSDRPPTCNMHPFVFKQGKVIAFFSTCCYVISYSISYDIIWYVAKQKKHGIFPFPATFFRSPTSIAMNSAVSKRLGSRYGFELAIKSSESGDEVPLEILCEGPIGMKKFQGRGDLWISYSNISMYHCMYACMYIYIYIYQNCLRAVYQYIQAYFWAVSNSGLMMS